MEIKKGVASKERIILLGMILSKKFLKGISPFFDSTKDCFSTGHTKIVAQWCWDYFQKYDFPVVENIKNIFEIEKDSLSEDDQKNIERFLVGISDEYVRKGKFNSGYALDIAQEYFKYRSLNNLKLNISKSLAINDTNTAEELIEQYTSKVAMKTVGWTDPFTEERIKESFEEENRDFLMRLPGKLGDATGDLEREFLMAFLGTSGIGKTWMLLFLSLSALMKGYNVLFVNLELSIKQLERRIYHYLTALPGKKNLELNIPVFDCALNQSDSCRKDIRVCNVGIGKRGYMLCTVCRRDKRGGAFVPVIYQKQIKRKIISLETVMKRVSNILSCNIIRGGKIRVLTYPSGTLTISELRKQIDLLSHYEAFMPDFIITDYADKFAAKHRGDQHRFQIKEIWEGHKALGQEYHCLVATGSQSSAARAERDTKSYDWAESTFKKDLIDLGIILNQSAKEKEQGIIRASIGKHRHDWYSETEQITVLQALKIGRPYLDSELM